MLPVPYLPEEIPACVAAGKTVRVASLWQRWTRRRASFRGERDVVNVERVVRGDDESWMCCLPIGGYNCSALLFPLSLPASTTLSFLYCTGLNFCRY